MWSGEGDWSARGGSNLKKSQQSVKKKKGGTHSSSAEHQKNKWHWKKGHLQMRKKKKSHEEKEQSARGKTNLGQGKVICGPMSREKQLFRTESELSGNRKKQPVDL